MTKSHFPEYQQQIFDMARRCREFYSTFDTIKDLIDLSDGQRQFIERRCSWIGRLEQPEFPVAFLGSYSTGKSTVINALIGREILPENMKAYTAIPTLIRSGAKDGAVVYYLDEKEKVELFNLWVHEVEQKLKRSLPYCKETDDPTEKLSEVRVAINAVNDPDMNFDKELYKLNRLVSRWNAHSSALPIGIDELIQYVVEDYEDVILVSRVEVSVADIQLPEEITLVDLPGLGVVNPLHKKITKDYVEREAKAFVICMKPDGLLEGDEINLLEEVHRQTPRILQRAFWVFNKWDAVNQQQSREIEQLFNEKMIDYGFAITPERKFRCSALNYLLLQSILNNNLDKTNKLKAHIDNLSKYGLTPDDINADQARSLIDQKPELRNFELFEQSLLSYLEKSARAEFIHDFKRELKQLLATVLPALERVKKTIIQTGSSKEELMINLVSRELDRLTSELKGKVALLVSEIRLDEGHSVNCWPPAVQQEVGNQIQARIKGLDKNELKNELLKGIDQDALMSRLPSEVEKRLKVAELLRGKFKQQIGDRVLIKFAERLLSDLNTEIALPESLQMELSPLLGADIIYSRIDGLADALLLDYGTQMDLIGLQKMPKAKEPQNNSKNGVDGELLQQALSVYQQELSAFIKKLSSDINRLSRRLIKNFAEAIDVVVPALIDQHKTSFTALVVAGTELNEDLYMEETRRNILMKASETLLHLSSGTAIDQLVDNFPEDQQ